MTSPIYLLRFRKHPALLLPFYEEMDSHSLLELDGWRQAKCISKRKEALGGELEHETTAFDDVEDFQEEMKRKALLYILLSD